MEFLSLLKSYAGIVSSVVSAILGGGALKAYNSWRETNLEADDQEHAQAMEWSERLEGRLASVEGRLDAAEEELRKTKRDLTQSRIKRQELRAAIDTLVERIDRLIRRLAQHEEITQEERQNLVSVPHVDDIHPNDTAPG